MYETFRLVLEIAFVVLVVVSIVSAIRKKNKKDGE